MATLLTDEECKAGLGNLPEWRLENLCLVRVTKRPSFLEGIDLVRRVAELAEASDHHPDIDIRWRTLTFGLTTHSAGGLTQKDFDLAREIEALMG